MRRDGTRDGKEDLNGGHCLPYKVWFLVKKASFKRVKRRKEEHRRGSHNQCIKVLVRKVRTTGAHFE